MPNRPFFVASCLRLTLLSLATACASDPPPAQGDMAASMAGTAGASPGQAGAAAGAGAGGSTSASAGTTGRAGTGAAGTSGRQAGGAGAGTAGQGGAGGTAAGSGGSPAAGSGGGPAAGSGGAAGGVAAGSGGGPAAGSGAPMPKKFVGNITTSGQVRSDFKMLWDQITPENEGKWGSVEATRDQMNWAGLDRVRDYAKANGVVFKQHTLVWGSQQPNWLGSLSAQEQREEVEEWIRLFCERYPEVAMIDVVNEPPPHTTPVYMNALGGAGSSGFDWIVQSFKWARQYCPNAILILNDYNNIEYQGDNTRFIDIATRVKNAGAPIDALGAQAHDAFKLPAATVKGFIDKLAAVGLPIYITEYDLDLADDAMQKQVLEAQFPMFWQDDRIKGITFWGYIVGSTWRPNTGLMTSGGMRRPAMTWLMEFLGR